MYGIDDTTSTPTMPTVKTAVSSGFFQAGNPTLSVPATTITADWLNIVQAELTYAVTSTGATLSKTNTTQLATAIGQIGKKTPGLMYFYFCTPTAVVASSTTYIGPSGVSTADAGAQWVMPVAGTITGVYLNVTAPGGATTAAATVFNNGASTAASTTITGSNTSGTYSGSVAVAANAPLAIHIVLSAGATTTYARGWFSVQPT